MVGNVPVDVEIGEAALLALSGPPSVPEALELNHARTQKDKLAFTLETQNSTHDTLARSTPRLPPALPAAYAR